MSTIKKIIEQQTKTAQSASSLLTYLLHGTESFLRS